MHRRQHLNRLRHLVGRQLPRPRNLLPHQPLDRLQDLFLALVGEEDEILAFTGIPQQQRMAAQNSVRVGDDQAFALLAKDTPQHHRRDNA